MKVLLLMYVKLCANMYYFTPPISALKNKINFFYKITKKISFF